MDKEVWCVQFMVEFDKMVKWFQELECCEVDCEVIFKCEDMECQNCVQVFVQLFGFVVLFFEFLVGLKIVGQGNGMFLQIGIGGVG